MSVERLILAMYPSTSQSTFLRRVVCFALSAFSSDAWRAMFLPLVSGAVLRLGAKFKRDTKKLQQPAKTLILRCFLGVYLLPIFHAMRSASRFAMLMLDKLLVSNHEKSIVLCCFFDS